MVPLANYLLIKGKTMKIKVLLVFLALLMFAVPMTASAFDGERQGFMLNLGAGFGQGKISWKGGSVDGTGICTDFKIGGGPSNQFLVYYTNRALWYSPDNSSVDLVNGMSAGGVTYFLEPKAPSFFFSGALGIGVLTDSEVSDSESGFGLTVGIGYEIVRNFIVEFTYMYAGLSNDYDEDPSISNLALTISWLAY